MKVQSGQYLENRVQAGNYGRIDIFSGHIDTHQGHNPFLTIRETDPSKTAERVTQFCSNNLGDFTIYLRAYSGQAWGNAEKMRVHLSRVPAVSDSGQLNGNFDLEQEIQRRLSEIRATEEAAKRLEELQAENARLQDPLQKLAFVGEILLAKFVGTIPGQATGQPLNGTASTTEELQQAVNGLVNKFGRSGVVTLNKKLDESPEMIQLVKNYAGI
jgi:hypothetical protein